MCVYTLQWKKCKRNFIRKTNYDKHKHITDTQCSPNQRKKNSIPWKHIFILFWLIDWKVVYYERTYVSKCLTGVTNFIEYATSMTHLPKNSNTWTTSAHNELKATFWSIAHCLNNKLVRNHLFHSYHSIEYTIS